MKKKDWKIDEKPYFTKSAGAGAKLGVRIRRRCAP